MMDPGESEEIVKNCVRKSRGKDGDVPVEKALQDVGIPSQDLVDDLRDNIVNDKEIGVPSRGYTIDPSDLPMSPSTKVSAVRDMVSDNAESAG